MLDASVPRWGKPPEMIWSGPVRAASFQTGSSSLPSIAGRDSVTGTRRTGLSSCLLSAAEVWQAHGTQASRPSRAERWSGFRIRCLLFCRSREPSGTGDGWGLGPHDQVPLGSRDLLWLPRRHLKP